MSSTTKASTPTTNSSSSKRTPESQQDSKSKLYLFAGFGVAVAAFFIFSLFINKAPENYPAQPPKLLTAREKLINSVPKRQFLIYTKEKMAGLIADALTFGGENSQALFQHAVAISNATEALQAKEAEGGDNQISESIKTLILHSLLFQSEDAHKRLVRELLVLPPQKQVSSTIELKAAARIVLEDQKGTDYLLFAPAVITVTRECGAEEEEEEDDNEDKQEGKVDVKTSRNKDKARRKKNKEAEEAKKLCTEVVHGFSTLMFKDSRTVPFMQLLQGTALPTKKELDADKQETKDKVAPFSYMEFLKEERYFPHNHLILLEEKAKIHFILKLSELLDDTEIYKKTRQIYEDIFFNKQLDAREGNVALGILWNADMGTRSFTAVHDNLEKLRAIVEAKKKQ